MTKAWTVLALALALLLIASRLAGAADRYSFVTGMRNTTRLAAGDAHSCLVGADGVVRCWGSNAAGQLGDNTNSNRKTPVAAANLTDAVAVVAGVSYTCALRAGGQVSCWGALTGAGSHKVPTSVAGLSDVVAISAGAQHICALKVNGSVSCMGDDAANQLGSGQLVSGTTSLIQVGGLTDIVAIATGSRHSCAVRITGEVKCWGAGGLLGDGSNPFQQHADAELTAVVGDGASAEVLEWTRAVLLDFVP